MIRSIPVMLLAAMPVQQAAAPSLIAIVHVTIIDGTGRPPADDMSVIVSNRHIVAIGPGASLPVPARAEVVDGRGKFLIPGLWDMHVHTSWDRHFTIPLMAANGVTGVREMFGKDLAAIRSVQADIRSGRLIGPRIIVGSRIVDGPDAGWPGSRIVRNEAEAREAVGEAKATGVDFIKVYSALNRRNFLAIAAEASDAGQKSVEHLTGVLLAASSHEDALRARLIGAGDLAAYLREYNAQQPELLATFDTARADRLFARFRANGDLADADARGPPGRVQHW